MFEININKENLDLAYQELYQQLQAISENVSDTIAILSNASSLLNCFLEDINWVGFYLKKSDRLVLGPFQGLPACVYIKLGKGVCGTSASLKQTMRVDDVHQFPGHIACDARSLSELVIPIIKNDEVIAVLDIDSPIHSRFTIQEQCYLEKFATILSQYL